MLYFIGFLFGLLCCFWFYFCFFAHFFCFYFAHIKGGMSRSNSRNSINQDLNSPRAENGGGRSGLSLASMGTGRHSEQRAAARATTPSRKGSSVYIGGNGDDSGVFLLLLFLFFWHFWLFVCFVFVCKLFFPSRRSTLLSNGLNTS